MTTGTDWINVMGSPTGVTATIAEYILDMAIDWLNAHGAGLDNMAGTAGSKTVTLTSKQRGAVFMAARIVYYSCYKRIEQIGFPAGITVSLPDLMSDPTINNQIEKLAHNIGEITLQAVEDSTGYDE